MRDETWTKIVQQLLVAVTREVICGALEEILHRVLLILIQARALIHSHCRCDVKLQREHEQRVVKSTCAIK